MTYENVKWLTKSDSFLDHLCRNGQTVLDLDALDLAVSQVATVSNQRLPRRMQILNGQIISRSPVSRKNLS